MTKYVLAVAACVVGTALISGCGKEEAAPSTPSATPTAQQTAEQLTKSIGGAQEQAKSVSSAVTTQAEKLLADATTYVKENKVDLADKAIKQLEDMKSQLPAEYGPKIDQLRKSLDAIKASGGVKIPGLK